VLQTSPVTTDHNWVHVCVVRQSDIYNIYAAGAVITGGYNSLNSVGVNFNSSGYPYRVGCSSASGVAVNCFTGSLADSLVIQEALSPSAIAHLGDPGNVMLDTGGGNCLLLPPRRLFFPSAGGGVVFNPSASEWWSQQPDQFPNQLVPVPY